ncbi:MAG: TPM domain-containing protein [Clostridiales bacterium]|nr:TPM domain-containing protein [Clostridiales bacterium]
MKRVLMILALLLLLAPLTQAQEMSHVSDLADRLTASERQRLQQQASELFELTGFDVIVHTTNDSQRKGPKDYSFDYYHSFRDAARYPDGALLAIMFDTRDYYEAARGKGISLLTYRESDDLARVVQSKLSDGDYYGAFSGYIRYVRRLLIPPTPMERAISLLPFLLIGGLVIGLVYALVLKGKLKIAKSRVGAQQYVVPNSLNLTDARDLFMYQTVTRRKIETNTSRGGGGGGFSSGSRGGTSYGGRGGKF